MGGAVSGTRTLFLLANQNATSCHEGRWATGTDLYISIRDLKLSYSSTLALFPYNYLYFLLPRYLLQLQLCTSSNNLAVRLRLCWDATDLVSFHCGIRRVRGFKHPGPVYPLLILLHMRVSALDVVVFLLYLIWSFY